MFVAKAERAYLGLGSNLDGPEGQLHCALRLLGGIPGIRVTHISSFYRTAPWGNLDQPDFVNAVTALDCALAPGDLLRTSCPSNAAWGAYVTPHAGRLARSIWICCVSEIAGCTQIN